MNRFLASLQTIDYSKPEAVEALLTSFNALGDAGLTDEFMNTVDPSIHGLVTLFALNARLEKMDGSVLQYCPRWAVSFPLGFISRPELGVFARRFVALVDSLNVPGLAVKILMSFCMRCSQLTCLHPILLKYILQTKQYDLDLGSTGITLPSGLDIQDYLLFQYYSALKCIGLKDYLLAMEHCCMCLIVPTSHAVSAIQLEAYKKLVLIALLHNGKPYGLPKLVSDAILRTCKKGCGPYLDLVKAFESRNIDKLRAEISKHSATFQKDGNQGLANNLVNACTRLAIRNLTKTYQTLSLMDMAKSIGFQQSDLELLQVILVDMIDSDQISARISYAQNGMVTFLDALEQFNSVASLSNLSNQYEQLSETLKKINMVSDEIALSPEYLKTFSSERLAPSSKSTFA